MNRDQLEKIKKHNFKNYKHIDKNMSLDQRLNYIEDIANNPKKVKEHRFLPVITFYKEMQKYYGRKPKGEPKIKNKRRPLVLTAHKDSLIYFYYSIILNDRYEDYLRKNNLSQVATAYRANSGKSNINAAKEIFDFVWNAENCWIIKGDFKAFFDNLRHRTLKQNLKTVLQGKVTGDWVSIIKSLTKYRYINKDTLERVIEFENIDTGKNFYFNRLLDFQNLISTKKLKVHGPNQVGIPQGTSLSAVLANVYMIEFDKIVCREIENLNGIYRRYSDDFVIVIPKSQKIKPQKVAERVINLSKEITSLEIEKSKTKILEYNRDDFSITNLSEDKKSVFDYLGFVFDGKVVNVREKTSYKFHYKGKRAVLALISHERLQMLLKESPSLGLFGEGKKLVYMNGEKTFRSLNKVEQKRRNELIKKEKEMCKQGKDHGLHSKITEFYLDDQTKGYSMLGYVKRAQEILEDGSKYDVTVLKQIKKLIREHQLVLSKMRLKYLT